MNGEARRVEVMHGVNLDQLGRRDPLQYGTLTLPELERRIEEEAQALGMRAHCFQTNHEGAFVEHLHALPVALEGADPDAVLAALGRDKKRLGDRVPFVLLRAPGEIEVGCELEPDEVRAAIAELAA